MKRFDVKCVAIVAYMLTAFGLTFMNIFVEMAPIGPAMLLMATPMIIIIDIVIDIVAMAKAKKEDKGL